MSEAERLIGNSTGTRIACGIGNAPVWYRMRDQGRNTMRDPSKKEVTAQGWEACDAVVTGAGKDIVPATRCHRVRQSNFDSSLT